MDIRELPVDEIVLDSNLNLRDKLDEFTVERYADAWDRMPPVTVFEIDEQWVLADGFHRHAAALSSNRPKIASEIRQGSYDDALDFVSGVNLFHGLPLTRAERRRAVEIKLRLHNDWSDRRLSEELGIGRELIGKIRKQLVEGGQLAESISRVGSDGKTYTSAGLPKDPNERLPKKGQGGEDVYSQGNPRSSKSANAPWDDTVDPLPPVDRPAKQGVAVLETSGHAESRPGSDSKRAALAPPVEPAAPTIEEMLTLMTKQIMEVVAWTQADGFLDAYKTASGNARGLFHTAAIKLAARADQLRRAS